MKKKNRYLTLLLILLAVSVGYAALSTQLKINGTANITKNTWSVYWDEDSITITEGSKGNTEPDVVNGDDGSSNTKVTWEVTLDLPGDFYEFTIDAANAGTVDAMITGITPTVPSNLPSYISYSVTYADGTAPAENHLLAKGTKSGNTIIPTTETYKVRVEYLDTVTPADLNAIGTNGDTYQFSYQVTYGQATTAAVNPHPVVDTCPGPNCVYAFYTDLKAYTDYDYNNDEPLQRSTLTNYTSDYTTLQNNGVQRKYFFGHILDSNNVIQRAFVCGLKDGNKLFCLEGVNSAGGEDPTGIRQRNLNTLNSADLWNNTCLDTGHGYRCESSDLTAEVECTTAIYDSWSNGCFINYDSGGAWFDGQMKCTEQ